MPCTDAWHPTPTHTHTELNFTFPPSGGLPRLPSLHPTGRVARATWSSRRYPRGGILSQLPTSQIEQHVEVIREEVRRLVDFGLVDAAASVPASTSASDLASTSASDSAGRAGGGGGGAGRGGGRGESGGRRRGGRGGSGRGGCGGGARGGAVQSKLHAIVTRLDSRLNRDIGEWKQWTISSASSNSTTTTTTTHTTRAKTMSAMKWKLSDRPNKGARVVGS